MCAAEYYINKKFAAVGRLQFDVLQYRLKNEYGVETNLSSLPYECSAWLIGARADGYAPSPKKALRWKRAKERVRLVLHGPGGTLEGRVHDDAGPVRGVSVNGEAHSNLPV